MSGLSLQGMLWVSFLQGGLDTCIVHANTMLFLGFVIKAGYRSGQLDSYPKFRKGRLSTSVPLVFFLMVAVVE